MDIRAVVQYIAVVWKRYQKANSRKERTVILDEIVSNLGIHRKSANRLMLSPSEPKKCQGKKGGRKLKYSAESREHLIILWKSMGRMGARRMKAALPNWIKFYDRCDESVTKEILRMSESTIERILFGPKAEFRRRLNSGTRRPKPFFTEIPVRNKAEPIEKLGHIEGDTVAHCGGRMSGQFAWTLNTTDIKSGWTENEAMWGKHGVYVRKAMRLIEARLPFEIECFYSDCGNEFLNSCFIEGYIKAKHRSKSLEYYRGRPYHKNDQCYIEQKNNTHVRELFGYSRVNLEYLVGMMNAIYRQEWRLLQNFFYPQQKLEHKYRLGSKLKRKMSRALTPYQRLMESDQLNQEQKRKLAKRYQSLNPFKLQENLRRKIQQFNQILSSMSPDVTEGRYAIS